MPCVSLAPARWGRSTFGRTTFASSTPGSVSAVVPLLHGPGGPLPTGTRGLPGASTAFRRVACSGRRPR
eukprot:6742789-Alexandrium_andersonii.AAC.1